jgi:hypothetical protein
VEISASKLEGTSATVVTLSSPPIRRLLTGSLKASASGIAVRHPGFTSKSLS